MKGATYYKDGKVTSAASGDTKTAEIAKGKAFMRVVWKDQTTVGFGTRGKYTIAWYCNKAPKVDDSTSSNTNVSKTSSCIDQGAEGDKVNRCFQKEALKAVNEYRKMYRVPEIKAIAEADNKYTVADKGYLLAKEVQGKLLLAADKA